MRTVSFDGESVSVTQDVTDILENNKRLRGEAQRGDLRHVASIPLTFIDLWMREEWDRGNVSLRFPSPEFDGIIAKKLRDPDYAFLRTDSAMMQGFMGFGS